MLSSSRSLSSLRPFRKYSTSSYTPRNLAPKPPHTSKSHNVPERPDPSNNNNSLPKRQKLGSLNRPPIVLEDKDAVIRNEVGVQLLTPSLNSQIFRNASFPPPTSANVIIAREHLQSHGLDTSRGSVAHPISFTLPVLQGNNVDEHFHRIGSTVAEPHLSLARRFASIPPEDLPPRPEEWIHHPGWTKYYPDGSYEHIDSPGDETMLCFDVETMPPYHQFPIMACAVSPNAWYAWISPWLLRLTDDPQHLVPLGDPATSRVIVGHNVSYDRARIREEYSVERTGNRFLDTMALHVAVKGISSHQRPAWMSYRKQKKQDKEMVEESVEVIKDLMDEADDKYLHEADVAKKTDLLRLKKELQESLPQLRAASEDADVEETAKRWEDITAANSLADVARLHCGIEMNKAPRNDFMDSTPETILSSLDTYLSYCASDVSTTIAVYRKVLPAFLSACPSPVSMAGVMAMGNGFLPVNQTWEEYLRNAEGKYRELETKVREKLLLLAQQAFELAGSPEKYEGDDWLKQLDWTPKSPGVSRGVEKPKKPVQQKKAKAQPHPLGDSRPTLPKWYFDLTISAPFSPLHLRSIIPQLLRLSWQSFPLVHSATNGWTYRVPAENVAAGSLVHPDFPAVLDHSQQGFNLRMIKDKPTRQILGPTIGLKGLKTGTITSDHPDLAMAVCEKDRGDDVFKQVLRLADKALEDGPNTVDPWLSQLDWTLIDICSLGGKSLLGEEAGAKSAVQPITWPKWYWELASPKKGKAPGELDLTVRTRISPLLLRLRWLGWPLFHSREHGWTFRVTRPKPKTSRSPAAETFTTRQTPLIFTDPADEQFHLDSSSEQYTFYKLPHKDGESANVGSPLGKTFMKFAANGTLTSPGDDAKEALDMNAQCSYWISARDRVMGQMVVWDKESGTKMHLDSTHQQDQATPQKWGMILPQLITMGTVTRRAIEKTWLTASNAKPNRVGSELKAMVRAPPGYAMVGADVDSEELWISSVMGDAQFGLHGATAIGWMTLEGTKSSGTDLHSKTASILGITRDAAKVFNYSRIYGAGMKHAVLLLLQSNPGMLPEEAQRLAKNLYASTKGQKSYRKDLFGRRFWYGGTESYVFNKLEEIALSENPQTPALGCGITRALSKEYLPESFGSDYMTSRINWVVQSSGVDYLHLLIVSMEYLIAKYDINARFLISVHDELRYLVKEEDKYRCALALQIANLWTRSLFAFKLGMADLPQGVAFFSAVDVDHVLRKEVDMTCVTPSQPIPIPPGESINIAQTLEKTSGSLWKDHRVMEKEDDTTQWDIPDGYAQPDCLIHRADGPAFLRAQATTEAGELKMLAKTLAKEKLAARSSEGPRKPSGRATTSKSSSKKSASPDSVDIADNRTTASLEDWYDACTSP